MIYGCYTIDKKTNKIVSQHLISDFDKMPDNIKKYVGETEFVLESKKFYFYFVILAAVYETNP